MLLRLSHNLDSWIGKQGLDAAETTEMELGLKTSKVMEALAQCQFHKVTIPIFVESKSFVDCSASWSRYRVVENRTKAFGNEFVSHY